MIYNVMAEWLLAATNFNKKWQKECKDVLIRDTFSYSFNSLMPTNTIYSSLCELSGDDNEEESGEERLPSCFDYIMHFLTVFWKVLFAFVPPTEYWNGWACFIVSICLIGALTAVTGDLASHFGCTIGLKDSVTAVVFVALGTSVPGKCPSYHIIQRNRFSSLFTCKREFVNSGIKLMYETILIKEKSIFLHFLKNT